MPVLLLCSVPLPSSPTDLSEMLAEGTKESHDRAENCQFVKDFLRGRIKRELFKVGLPRHHAFCINIYVFNISFNIVGKKNKKLFAG